MSRRYRELLAIMGALDSTLGGLLFASWANTILELRRIFKCYFDLCLMPSKDSWVNTAAVLSVASCDSLIVFACLSSTYRSTVTVGFTKVFSFFIAGPRSLVLGQALERMSICRWL
ncbi:hypothetical protein C8J56DRAFT_957915 [Mycena floridula]|nr:hypothetical protein C8J56DRAFT_957915 [Mycena floridula]